MRLLRCIPIRAPKKDEVVEGTDPTPPKKDEVVEVFTAAFPKKDEVVEAG